MRTILNALLTLCLSLHLVSCNEGEVNALEKHNAALQQKNAELKAQAVNQQTQIEEREKESETLQRENADLNDKLTAATAKVSELKNALAENATQLEHLTEERDALQAEVTKIAEAEEKKQKELTKYSHEALGDSPTREQLLALFDAYETIAKDAPDVLEQIFQEAVTAENTVTREGQIFLKGKFKPYTGWFLKHDLDSDQPQKDRDELPGLYSNNYIAYVKDGVEGGIFYSFGPDLQLLQLSVGNPMPIRTKRWYGPGALSRDLIWKEWGESFYLQEGGNDGALLEARSWIQENGKLRKCPKTDFKNGDGTYVAYDRLGRINTLTSFKNGIISTRETYGLDEKLSSRTEFAAGVQKRWTTFTPRGFKSLEVSYDVEKRAELLNNAKQSVEGIEDIIEATTKRNAQLAAMRKISMLSETRYNYRTGKPESRTHYKNGTVIRKESLR